MTYFSIKTRFHIALAVAAGVSLYAFCAQAETKKDFAIWLQHMRAEAKVEGISQEVVDIALPDTLKPIPKIIELDRKQPEKTATFESYLTKVINKTRIERGRQMLQQHRNLLNRVSEAYGVQPEYIVALWGIETSYGQNTGGYQVIPALATLAYEGRREAFFRDELLKALKIVDQDHISIGDMKGSWAGAMGQVQFMPSSFFRFAEDFDKDGHRDIWNTKADVFASAANYLSKSGWNASQSWGQEVKLPENLDRGLIGLDKSDTLQAWYDLGVRQKNGKALSYNGAYQASIIQPDGPGTKAYAVYGNYRVIMKWNKSTYFATAVGLLADHLKGW